MTGEPLLIVDDNPVNLKLIQVLLSAEGYEVHTAANADQALRVLEGWRPRLILMDIQLPDIDGLALTQQLKSRPDTRDIPVVALTAYAMKGDDQRAYACGCSGYITKPIDTRSFAVQIAKFLAAPAGGGGP